MENTNKSQSEQLNETAVKRRFFAQYLGQTIYKHPTKRNGGFIQLSGKDLEKGWLELKPVDKITDKECCELFDKFYPNAIKYSSLEKIVDIKSTIRSNFSEDVIIDEDFIFYVDFMRSKGYALPFMNYSVDDLVKMGWVQLV